MLRRRDDAPLMPGCGHRGCTQRMACSVTKDGLAICNPHGMWLRIQPGPPRVRPGPAPAKPCAGCGRLVRLPADGPRHASLSGVDDATADRLAADPGIPAIIDLLEVGTVCMQPPAQAISDAGLHALLRIACPLSIIVPDGSRLTPEGLAALPPRLDAVIELVVPETLHADFLSVRHPLMQRRIRISARPAHRSRPDDSEPDPSQDD